MKKIIAFMLNLSILICAVSCTDRVHMDDITDEYERHIKIFNPDTDVPLIGGSTIFAEGISYNEMLDLIEQYYTSKNSEPRFLYPREGEFEAEDGEKFISKVGVCNIYHYPPASCHIRFKLRIFDSKGYLIVEDDIVVYDGITEQDFDNWWIGSSLKPDDEIFKYWMVIATPST